MRNKKLSVILSNYIYDLKLYMMGDVYDPIENLYF